MREEAANVLRSIPEQMLEVLSAEMRDTTRNVVRGWVDKLDGVTPDIRDEIVGGVTPIMLGNQLSEVLACSVASPEELAAKCIFMNDMIKKQLIAKYEAKHPGEIAAAKKRLYDVDAEPPAL